MERTFGMELEFADGDKDMIVLPKGYQWTDNELTRMINTDGTNVTHRGRYGGEINTKPYTRSKEDMEHLQDFLNHLKDSGAVPIWNTGFDSHLYVRDLGIEEVKKFFILSYHIAPYLKKIFDIAEWFENKYVCPSPTYDYVEKVKKAETFEQIIQCFANASHRGHIRFYINLVPLIKIGTIEFRLFNTTFEKDKIKEIVDFMYSYIDYAMKNDEDDYSKLDSVEKVVEALNINPELIPKRTEPLLFAGEMTDFTTILGKRERKNSKILGGIKKGIGDKKVQIVNSYWFDLEQAFRQNERELYTKDIFTFYCLEIINDKYKLEWKDDFEFLNEYNSNSTERLSALILFSKMKAMNGNDEYHKLMWKNYIETADKKIKDLNEKSSKIVERLIGMPYKIGDITDAIKEWNDDKVIVYQNEFCPEFRSISNALCNYSDAVGFEEKYLTKYYDLGLENTKYMLLSRHSALGLPKLLIDNRVILYGNCTEYSKYFLNKRNIEQPKYKRLPSDYIITDKSVVKFIRAKANEIDYLRMMYLKKDILLGSGKFNYLFFVDDYLFGATIMDFSKTGNVEIAWLKSDFVIDSNVKKLSKLLIMATLTEDYKKELFVKYKMNMLELSTNVFTDKPVSMKYRGVYKLDHRENGKLNYRAILGKYKNNEELIRDYLKRL